MMQAVNFGLHNFTDPTGFDKSRYIHIQSERQLRELLGKADLMTTTATAVAHVMNAEQSAHFFSLGQDLSPMINDSTVQPMEANTEDLNQIYVDGLAGTIGGPGEATAVVAGDRAVAVFTRAQLASEEFLFQGRVAKHWLEDNIEKEGGWDTVQGEFSNGFKWGLENAAWGGNTAVANPGGWGARLGTTINGWRTQAVSNTYDHAGAFPSRLLYFQMILQLPTRYRTADFKRRYRFYAHQDVVEYTKYILETRGTTAGDGFLLKDNKLFYHGIPFVEAACIGTTYTGTGLASGLGDDATEVLLCEPKNKVVGYHRNMTVYRAINFEGRMHWVTMSVRIDVTYQNEAAVVRAFNVQSP